MSKLSVELNTKKEARNTLFKYAISSIGAMWVFTIYTMVDGIFVAKGVGPNALAAVNLAMPFINFSFALSILFAIGASTKASIYKGEGNTHKADVVFTKSTVTVSVIAIVITIFSLLFIDKLCIFLGGDSLTMPYLKTYIRIILLFDICYMTSYNLEVLLKADGYPQKAMYTVLLGAVVNIGLDYLFIFKLGYGIGGAAFATGLAQLTSLSIFLIHFYRNNRRKGFKFTREGLNVRGSLGLAKLGVADFTTELAMGVVIFMFNRVLLIISGEEAIVVYTVISYVSQLILMTMVGLNHGMQPLVSFYLGRGDREKQLYIFRLSAFLALFMSVFAFCLGFFSPQLLVGLFIDKNTDIHLFLHGIQAFRLYSISFLPIGLVVVISGYFTAVEKPKSAMIISICRGLIFVIAALIIMSYFFGEKGVWLCTSISESLSLGLAITIYLQNKKEMRDE